MKKTVIYVHGLNSSGNSSTASSLKAYLRSFDIDVVTPTFDYSHPDVVNTQLKNLVVKHFPCVVIGSSLGGFYVLRQRNCKKIVMNPCLYPVTELPKLGVDENIVSKYKHMQQTLFNGWDAEETKSTIGIFGSNDELFSYKSELSSKIDRVIATSDKHRISPTTLRFVVIPIIVEYFSSVNESLAKDILLNERFVTCTQDDTMQQYKHVVYNMLYKAYQKIGGIAGIANADDLVNDTDIWKLVKRGTYITAVACYSTKRGGRKCVAIASDGTTSGKADLFKIMQEDIDLKDRQAWLEVSGKPEQHMKRMGANPIPTDMVKLLLPDKQIISIDSDGYHYTRMIGGNLHTKICYGNYSK